MPILGCLKMVEMHDGCTMTVGNDYEFFGMLCFAVPWSSICHVGREGKQGHRIGWGSL
jgi:hypothetical protein